jgi:regulator of replication initiation timing
MQNDYSAQNGGANPEGSEDGAATEEDEIMKDYPLPGLMDELEKNVKDLRMDNTKLRSNLETLQLKCEQLERTLQAQQEIHELASENYGKEVQRLRSRREDYKKSLDIIQAKLIWDYYATKFPEEGPRLKDCHRKGEWLPNDQIIDELLQDFVILGSRNAELLTENEKLRINLDTIQKSALSNVERFQPTQDDELTEHFNGLASAIKLLTRDIPATIDPDTLAEMFGSWTLLRGVSASFWKTKLHMRCLLEAAIWSLLMDTVFSTPFYIFGGEHAQACMTQWMELFARSTTYFTIHAA